VNIVDDRRGYGPPARDTWSRNGFLKED